MRESDSVAYPDSPFRGAAASLDCSQGRSPLDPFEEYLQSKTGLRYQPLRKILWKALIDLTPAVYVKQGSEARASMDAALYSLTQIMCHTSCLALLLRMEQWSANDVCADATLMIPYLQSGISCGLQTHLREAGRERESLALQDPSPLQSGESRQAVRVHYDIVPVLLHQQSLNRFGIFTTSVSKLAHHLQA